MPPSDGPSLLPGPDIWIAETRNESVREAVLRFDRERRLQLFRVIWTGRALMAHPFMGGTDRVELHFIETLMAVDAIVPDPCCSVCFAGGGTL